MNISWKSLAWSAAAVVLLLLLATPFSVFSLFLLMVPFIVLFTMLDIKSFVLHLVPVGIIAYLLTGVLGPMVAALGLIYLVPAIGMGHLYKKGSSARAALTAGFVILLAQMLLGLVFFSIMIDIDVKAELVAVVTQSLENAKLVESGWVVEAFKNLIDAIVLYLPTVVLTMAFVIAATGHGLSRLALRTVDIEAPALPEAKTWRVPRSLLLYFFIAMLAVSAMSKDQGGYWWIAIYNLVPVLQIAFTIQAIGFLFFLADNKDWPKIAPLLLCIPLLMLPWTFLIGLLDAAFPLRKYFVK
ncbi:DUF2232 domain-containing protein [Cohnella boryungensis]|uniref:DUF2232 domain-containing protein n=1 Tax=Cohnella boryungensis TaxID=768479 RepID=A0ABV8S3W6_9BACL